MRMFWILAAVVLLSACVTPHPRNVNNLCSIFHQYPDWYRASKDVERRWHVPVTVQINHGFFKYVLC